MGKSVGGQQLAVNVAKQGYGVAYIHLEMGADEVGLRLASALAWDPKRINAIGAEPNPQYLAAANNTLSPLQWERMQHAARALAPELPIYIDDRPGRTVAQIEAAIRRLFLRMKRDGRTPGLWEIDHEGLITPDQKYPSQLEAASARANGLKNMAKRLGVWGLVLSQITKEGSRADGDERLPQSTDLNYGSALSQAADVVILVHRRAYYAERKPHTVRTEEDIGIALSRECTLVIDKARGGRRAHVQAIMDVASAVLIEQE
jgi:replicative DNA helicase